MALISVTDKSAISHIDLFCYWFYRIFMAHMAIPMIAIELYYVCVILEGSTINGMEHKSTRAQDTERVYRPAA